MCYGPTTPSSSRRTQRPDDGGRGGSRRLSVRPSPMWATTSTLSAASVAVPVDGLVIGDNIEQSNVFVDVVEDPKIDFDRLLGRPEVAAALGALVAEPGDPVLRQAAADAVAGVRSRARREWTSEYASAPGVKNTRSAHWLDGTVAVLRCRAVQIGDYCYQENTFVCALSPTIDAAATLGDSPELVDGLLDLVCSGGRRCEMKAFEAALGEELTATMADAAGTHDDRGIECRPPAPGRTIRVRKAQGAAIGENVVQTNDSQAICALTDPFRRRTNGLGVRRDSPAQRAADLPTGIGPAELVRLRMIRSRRSAVDFDIDDAEKAWAVATGREQPVRRRGPRVR